MTTPPDLTIYTIGHSNIQVEQLVGLLLRFGIRILVDVRSSPYAKYATQFNREEFKAHPAMKPFIYCYAGKQLGGRPENEVFYDEDGYVNYEDIANSYTFEEGLEKLLELAGKAPTAVMCSEEDPHTCHRRLLIGRVLEEQGITVKHIRGDGRVQTEADLALDETRGQLGLGFEEIEATPWRSAQSVLPRKAPPDSSDF